MSYPVGNEAVVEPGFFVHGEFWTTDEWTVAALAGDWERRKERVAREYAAAVLQLRVQEFEAAWAQRIAAGRGRGKASVVTAEAA